MDDLPEAAVATDQRVLNPPMSNDSTPTLRRTAWQEAGHAVVAWDQKVKVTLVSIKPDAKSLGRTEQERASDPDPALARQRDNIVTMGGWAGENASGEHMDAEMRKIIPRRLAGGLHWLHPGAPGERGAWFARPCPGCTSVSVRTD